MKLYFPVVNLINIRKHLTVQTELASNILCPNGNIPQFLGPLFQFGHFYIFGHFFRKAAILFQVDLLTFGNFCVHTSGIQNSIKDLNSCITTLNTSYYIFGSTSYLFKTTFLKFYSKFSALLSKNRCLFLTMNRNLVVKGLFRSSGRV